MWGTAWDIAKAIGRAVTLAVLGLLVVLFWPKQTQRVGDTVVAQPLPSVGVGLLSMVVAFCVGLVLLIAACSGLLVWLAAAMAFILGWTAVGLTVGHRVFDALRIRSTQPLEAMAGVAIISLVWAVPCLGALFAFIVGSAGMGAVVLTRAGTRAYPVLAVLPSLPPEPSQAPEDVPDTEE